MTLTVEDGRISNIVRAGPLAESEPETYLSAGLVDLQVNGFRGLDLNANGMNAQTVSDLVRELLSVGVTTFAPTLITASENDLLHRLSCIAEARKADALAMACIPYVHVEGPHISPIDGYRGAHPLEHVRPPSLAEFNRWQAACGDTVGLVTLSPHWDGSAAYISELAKRGVVVALGHTHASAEQIHAAAEAGARLSTHLGNGVAPQIDRHSNPIWPQLADDRLTASFIADGHHLPADTLRAMMRAKGADRCVLVSDSVALAGMAPGRYHAAVGGVVDLSADGRLSMAGTTTLAGSAVSLSTCVERAVARTGWPLAQILPMVTANPGAFAGGRGRLAIGEPADLIQFAWHKTTSTLLLEAVWVAGRRFER